MLAGTVSQYKQQEQQHDPDKRAKYARQPATEIVCTYIHHKLGCQQLTKTLTVSTTSAQPLSICEILILSHCI